MRFSVLVPCFNSERYVRRCITSIINQSCSDFELLIYLDGCTDKTKQQINLIQDKRIKLFEGRINKGLSYARNFLISKASGEMIVNIDSDDYVDFDYLKDMNEILNRYPWLDIIFMGIKVKSEKGKLSDFHFKTKGVLKNPYFIYKIMTPYNYNQIIKRTLFENIKYPGGHNYEDIDTLYKIIDKCKKAYIHDKSYYHYCHNETSITRSVSETDCLDKIRAYFHFLFFIKDRVPIEDLKFQLVNLYQSVNYYIHKFDVKTESFLLLRNLAKNAESFKKNSINFFL